MPGHMTIGCNLPCFAVTTDDGGNQTLFVELGRWYWCGVNGFQPTPLDVDGYQLEGHDRRKATKVLSFAVGCCVRVDNPERWSCCSSDSVTKTGAMQ